MNKIEFAHKRLETDINKVDKQKFNEFLANCHIWNPTWQDTGKTSAYQFIDDGGHSYCIVPLEDKNYKLAETFESVYSRHYRQKDGTILLEEDCDATAFLKAVGE